MKQKTKKIFSWIASLFGILLLLPFNAHAIFFLGPAVIGLVTYAILYILQYIGSLFFSIAGYFVGFFLEFNYKILDTTNSVVYVGWEIARDIANLGFVIVIVIIGVATIFRFKDYSAKQLLPKLIAAAILVNFSLSLAGVLIGFSHVVTKYFFNAVESSGSTTKLVETISGAFDPQALFVESSEPEPIDPAEEAGGLSGFGTSMLLDIAGLFFTVIFIFTAAFVLLAFALMLLLRYIWLSFLLVLAPIVWLFWVMPSLSKQFTKWWDRFFQWVFFAPAVSFFFYLALLSVSKMKRGAGAISASAFTKNSGISTLMMQGAKMVVLVGLLVGGLMVAQSMSIGGAKMMSGFASKQGKKAKAWVENKTKTGVSQATTRALMSDSARSTVGKIQTMGKDKWYGAALQPFRSIGGAVAKRTEKGLDDYEKIKSDLNKLSDPELSKRTTSTGNYMERRAGTELLMRRAQTQGDKTAKSWKEKEKAVEKERNATKQVQDKEQNRQNIETELNNKQTSLPIKEGELASLQSALLTLKQELNNALTQGNAALAGTKRNDIAQKEIELKNKEVEVKDLKNGISKTENKLESAIKSLEMAMEKEKEAIKENKEKSKDYASAIRDALNFYNRDLANLPAQTRSDMGDMKTYIKEVKAGKETNEFDIANRKITEDSTIIYRERPAREFIRTVFDIHKNKEVEDPKTSPKNSRGDDKK